jgi:hypothetical protein
MALSLGCFLSGKKHSAIILGQYAPSLLVIRLYNKQVKVEGYNEEDKNDKVQNQSSTRPGFA